MALSGLIPTAGTARRVGLGLALAASFMAGTARAQDEKLPKAEALIDKYIEATGGKAAYEKLKNRVVTARVEFVGAGMKGPVTTYEQAPNLSRTIIDLEGAGKVENGTDGKVYWELSQMQGPRVLEGKERAATVRQTAFYGFVDWKRLYKKAETVGKEKVGDKDAYKVVMTPEEGAPEVWYFDAESGLEIKGEMKLDTPMGELDVEITMADYKKVDGVSVPHKLTQKVMQMQQSITIEKIEHNVDMPKDRFDLPSEIKELIAKPKKADKPAEKPAAEKP